MPDAGRWVCAGTFKGRYVEEDRALVGNEGLQGLEGDGGASGNGGGDWCAVLLDAVAGCGIEVGLGAGGEGLES